MNLTYNENGLLTSPCRECIFAQFTETPGKHWHKTQIGCQFNRPHKFKQRGTSIEWVEKDDVDSWEIGVFCNNIRDKHWMEENGLNLDEAIKRVKTDNAISWSAVIINRNKEKESIYKAIESLLNQDIQPINIILYIDKESVSLVNEIRTWFSKLDIDTKLYFARNLSNQYTFEEIDLSTNRLEGQYYVVIFNDSELPNVLGKLNSDINEDCKMVSMVEGNGFFIGHMGVHKALGGFEGGNLQDKLVDIDEKYKNSILKY